MGKGKVVIHSFTGQRVLSAYVLGTSLVDIGGGGTSWVG